MKKVLFFLILFLSLNMNFNAQDQIIWSKTIGNENADYGKSSIDSEGSLYFFGSYRSVLDLDPDLANEINAQCTGFTDHYLIKLSNTGDLLWSKTIVGNFYISPVSTDTISFYMDIAISGDDEIIISGLFKDTVNFSTDVNERLISNNNSDVFICKFDQNGNYLSSFSFGGDVSIYPETLSIDAQNNIYSTGIYAGSQSDFDPTTNIYNLPWTSGWDAYVVKFNSDNNFLYAKQFSCDFTVNTKLHIVDSEMNSYVIGDFNSDTDFDPSANQHIVDNGFNLTKVNFLLKLDSAGNFVWVNSFIDDIYVVDFKVSTNHLFLTGSYDVANLGDSIDINFVSNAENYIHSLYTTSGMFLSKIDLDGNLVWKENIEGVNLYPYNLNINSDDLFISGEFKDSVFLNDGYSRENYDVFIIKYDLNNTLFSGFNYFGGENDEFLYNTHLYNNELFINGLFYTSTSFNTIDGTNEHVSNGDTDIFIAKLDENLLSVDKVKDFDSNEVLFPNPSLDFISFRNDANSEISIQDINGKQISKELFFVTKNQIDIRKLNSGMYFLVLNGESYKIVKN